MFSENNLGKDYSSISKHELRLHVCNNERDINESLRNIIDTINFNMVINFPPFVNISRIKKFKDLCDTDIANRYILIAIIKKIHIISETMHFFAYILQTISYFKTYILPIFIILSLLGNSLSAIVLFRKKMRSFTSNIYLGILAICDIIYSITLLFHLFFLFKKPKENYAHYLAFFIQFLIYFSQFLSVWLIVAFTIERYIVTKYPLLRRSWCTVKRTKIIIIILTGLAFLYSILQMFFNYENENVGYKLSKQKISVYDLFKYLQFITVKKITYPTRIINTVILFTLPAFVIVICNTLIGYYIYQQNRVRKTLLTSDSNERTQISSDKMLQRKITKTLILVSSIFIFLKLPEHSASYFSYYIPKYIDQTVMYITFDILDTAHYSINFILYCATGQTFRTELIRIFTKRTNIRRNRNGRRNGQL